LRSDALVSWYGKGNLPGHRLKILDKCIEIPHVQKALSSPSSWFHWGDGKKD